jgi:DNA-directed RNA polymerase subunit E'/Rpb7
MYFKNVITTKITVQPSELNENLENVILERLRTKIEGRCIKDGYVMPNSIAILKRTLGECAKNGITIGDIVFNILSVMEICNPVVNEQFVVRVLDVNKIGCMGESLQKEMEVVMIKQHHDNKEVFSELKKNDYLLVSVIGKKFDLNDNKLSVIARIVRKLEDQDEIKQLDEQYRKLSSSPNYEDEQQVIIDKSEEVVPVEKIEEKIEENSVVSTTSSKSSKRSSKSSGSTLSSNASDKKKRIKIVSE